MSQTVDLKTAPQITNKIRCGKEEKRLKNPHVEQSLSDLEITKKKGGGKIK